MDSSCCYNHESNPIAARCSRCGRQLCEVCRFLVGSATYCPDCMLSGPSSDERSSVFKGGLLSVGLALAGYAMMVGFMAAGAMGIDIASWDRLLTTLWCVSSVSGIGTGIVAREGARRTGSILPTIGIVANGVLVAVQLYFIAAAAGS